MTVLFVPLVGMHFRPPAKQVLEALPAGAKLTLEPEPLNEWDQEAIRVMVDTSAIPQEAYPNLEVQLPGYGSSLEELLAQETIQLGYVAKTGSKACGSNQGNREVHEEMHKRRDMGLEWEGLDSRLGNLITGTPAVRIELPDDFPEGFDQ